MAKITKFPSDYEGGKDLIDAVSQLAKHLKSMIGLIADLDRRVVQLEVNSGIKALKQRPDNGI